MIVSVARKEGLARLWHRFYRQSEINEAWFDSYAQARVDNPIARRSAMLRYREELTRSHRNPADLYAAGMNLATEEGNFNAARLIALKLLLTRPNPQTLPHPLMSARRILTAAYASAAEREPNQSKKNEYNAIAVRMRKPLP